MGRLQDKTVLITGGSGGIGRVTAERALEEGANVVLVDIDEDGLQEVKKDLKEEEFGGEADDAKQGFIDDIPMGEYAEPIDIANLVIFLGSDESRFITGSQYRVDGGMGAQQ